MDWEHESNAAPSYLLCYHAEHSALGALDFGEE